MNKREICNLESDFHNAFALELADTLDTLISGYNFRWSVGNGCFCIRDTDHEPSRVAIELYLSLWYTQIQLLLSHYSYPSIDGKRNRQNHKNYCLDDPKHSAESIAADIVNMLNSILPYDEVTDKF